MDHRNVSSDPPANFESRGSSRSLVVLLHAFSLGPRSLQHVERACEDAFPDADLWTPRLTAARWSFHDPNVITQRLLEGLDGIWAARKARGGGAEAYQEIILVGHSMGALVARKLFVCAHGENSDAPLEDELTTKTPRDWAVRVTRIILLAGMNRGWSISHHLSFKHAIWWWLGSLLGNLLMMLTRRRLLIFQFRRGAPFITQLRIQWLSMERHAAAKGIVSPLTVQLLGTIDDMVSPEDNVDLVTGSDFVYLDVPHSGHVSVLDMDDSVIGRERRAILDFALRGSPAELREARVIPTDLVPHPPREEVTDVIFVTHGIRDKGFWTHRIARKVKVLGMAADPPRNFETKTSSYGYFPMLPFLLSRGRRRKVEWLMDQYAEALALYPNANFSFVGPSNGTYLLAKALEEYPSCHFQNVVFAGSVVRTRYDWDRMIRTKRITAILNYVATADWVVAIFPKGFEMLRLQDLGSAGHDGFSFRGHQCNNAGVHCQIEYVRGGHGAALQEENWGAIARFIVHGTVQPPPYPIRADRRSRLIKVAGWLAPAIWIFIIGALIYGGLWIWEREWAEFAKAFALVGYLALISVTVTRV